MQDACTEMLSALKDNGFSRFDLRFLEYRALARTSLGLISNSCRNSQRSVHKTLAKWIHEQFEQLESHLSGHNFIEASNSAKLLQDIGRFMSGPFELYHNDLGNMFKDDESFDNLVKISDDKFGGAKLGQYFSLLELGDDATIGSVKKAYRRLSLRWHPDKNRDDENAEAMFKAVNEANEVLMDESNLKAFKRCSTQYKFVDNIRLVPSKLRDTTKQHLEDSEYDQVAETCV